MEIRTMQNLLYKQLSEEEKQQQQDLERKKLVNIYLHNYGFAFVRQADDTLKQLKIIFCEQSSVDTV